MTEYYQTEDKLSLITITGGVIREYHRMFVSESPVPLAKEELEPGEIVPPKRRGGRPKKKIHDQPKEINGKKQRKCGICGKPGHRKEKCPEALNDLKDIDEIEEETKDVSKPSDLNEEQELVIEIRNMWILDGENSLAVCNKLGITLDRFKEICQKYNLHR